MGVTIPEVRDTPALAVRGLSCAHGGEPLFAGVSLGVARGEFAALVGPNGAGKTTLLRAVLGLHPPAAGDILVLGTPVRGRPPAGVGYVPQVDAIDPDAPVDVEAFVRSGMWEPGPRWPAPARGERAAAAAALRRLGISDLADHPLAGLSGGERQRVLVARALVRSPALVLLDEPTAGVDAASVHDLLHFLADLRAEGTAILLATHDLNRIAAHVGRMIVFRRGVLADGPPERVLTPATLSRAFGTEMVVVRSSGLVLVGSPTPLPAGPRGGADAPVR